ncbi:hypothetical protein A0H81_10600 [Grifola frondosa]|uniref:Uncharacterized protein n=1 Tax=Grifola frondosa TaxID=5627 RepID=A0A1C7LXI3_GRIFR|nr:hypothetical protein A0H81_10600 [Grifola frondosa]
MSAVRACVHHGRSSNLESTARVQTRRHDVHPHFWLRIVRFASGNAHPSRPCAASATMTWEAVGIRRWIEVCGSSLLPARKDAPWHSCRVASKEGSAVPLAPPHKRCFVIRATLHGVRNLSSLLHLRAARGRMLVDGLLRLSRARTAPRTVALAPERALALLRVPPQRKPVLRLVGRDDRGFARLEFEHVRAARRARNDQARLDEVAHGRSSLCSSSPSTQ